MKLLFDAMLSPKLPAKLADLFPESEHVEIVDLQSSDTAIWAHAADSGMIIVTKDNDFQWRAEVHGPPPKVIMVRLGNCRTRLVESLLRMHSPDIEQFSADPSAAVLILPLESSVD